MHTRLCFVIGFCLLAGVQVVGQNGIFVEPPQYFTATGAVALAVGDFNGDGKLDLAVANTCAGGGCGNSSTVSVLLGNGDGTFRTHVDYAVGSYPDSVAVGDFNGDGKSDLAVANFGSSSVSVLFGNGDGTFQPHVDYGTGGSARSVAVGDFNGDGKLDLAVVGNGVSVFLNSGTGTFPTRADFGTGMIPTAVTVGDFNKDGNLDLAVATQCGPTGCHNTIGASVSVLLGNGNGTFQTQVNYPVGVLPVSISTADLNGDGFLDLAVANSGVPYADGSVTVLWGSSNGTFTRQDFNSGIEPTSVVVGDFNGDGQTDFAVTNTTDETVSVFVNQGGNNFSQPKIFYGAGAFPFAGVAGDFNGDQKLDVAVACGNAVCILLGDGSGGFSHTPLSYGAGNGANSVAIADLNGDKKNDVVVANYFDRTVSVFLGSGGGAFQPPVSYNVGTVISVAIGDLNGDGKPDLVVTSGNVEVLLNNGDGTFQAPVVYDTAAGAYSSAIGDLNGDGKLDLAVACADSGSISILLGNGDGTFQAHSDLGVGVQPEGIALGDFNGDGKLDIAVVNSGESTVTILLNNGKGGFGGPPPILLKNGYSGTYTAVAVSDLNGDGRLDLAVAGQGNGSSGIAVVLGNGDGTFQTPAYYPGIGGTSIAVADFNGDSIPDIAAGTFYGVDLFVGKGDGTFRPHVIYPTGSSQISSALALGDLNGDGKPDLAVTNGFGNFGYSSFVVSNTLTILLNAGETTQPEFSVSAPCCATPGRVTAGQSATAKVTAASTGGFTGTVTFTCKVTPTPSSAPTCSLSPTQVTLTRGGEATSTLTVNTTAATAFLIRPHFGRGLAPIYAIVFPVFGAALMGMSFGSGGRRRKRLVGVAIGSVLFAGLILQMACGGGGGSGGGHGTPGTPAGKYTITVTGSSGSTQHTTTVTLTVQ